MSWRNSIALKSEFTVTPYLTLLRQNPGFRRLWLAQVISLLGDWFSTIVLSALIRDLTVGSGYEEKADRQPFV
ncbi:MAG: hypothetical protein AAFR22_25945, partial [Chloroflexota bacterium]